MGFFKGGKGNSKPAKAGSSKKQKAPAKNKKQGKALFGKKKEQTLIERMQLEESVATASLAVMHEIADRDDSAMRELDDGLLIVAITNEHLVSAGLDPESEEFGGFAEALRQESIESITLTNDLANGVIGILPSQESLVALDEFDFIRDVSFNWALAAHDLEDNDTLTLLDDTVTLARLMEMANDPGIELSLVDGHVEELSHGAEDTDLYEDGVEQSFDESEDDMVPMSYDEYPDESLDAGESDFDDDHSFGDYTPNDDFDEPTFDLPEIEDTEEPLDAGYSDFDDADEALELDAPVYAAPIDEGPSAEESKEAVNRLVNHGFNNTELELSIDMTKFDDYFDSVKPAQFDTTRDEGGELNNVLVNIRKDANTEISRFHQDNLIELRNKYTTSLRDVHDKLVASLDHRDEGTTYGAKFVDIESVFNDAMNDMDRKVSGVVRAMNKTYNESREEYGENAKREAFAVYDTRYKPEHERKVGLVRDTISTDIKTDRDVQLAEMYQDRRTVAKRLFDKAETALLQTLQDEYRKIVYKELEMYDAFRKNMDGFGRRHFSDEVLRSKAEAEKLRQQHEAESVRKEYEQMLRTQEQKLIEASNLARENMRQLELTHGEQVESVRKDLENRIEREQRDNQELRKSLQESNAAITKVKEQTKAEYEHQIKIYEDRVAAQTLQIDNQLKDEQRKMKPFKWVGVAIGSVAIMLGIMIGLLIGAGSTDVQVAPGAGQAQLEQQQPSANDSSYVVPVESDYDFVLENIAA